MGVAPADASHRDYIYILLGALVPFLLRKEMDYYYYRGSLRPWIYAWSSYRNDGREELEPVEIHSC